MKLQIKIDGKTYEAEVDVLEEDESPDQPAYEPSQSFEMQSQVPLADTFTPAATLNVHEGDDKFYTSPVNGLVISVNVVPGQQVEAGELILVLEAMKMETGITARQAGKVKSVNVAPSDSARLHQVLVEFE